MTGKNNLISIDLARATAALSVFIDHFQMGRILVKFTGITWLSWVSFPGAYFGAALFFVISGFCIHGSEWRRLQRDVGATFHLGAYCERRFRRIYPMYLFTLLVSVLLLGYTSQWPSWPDITLHALLLHGFSTPYFNTINLVLWTISVEAFFYVIYPVWLHCRIRFGLLPAALAGGLLSFTSCAVTAAYFYPYDLPARWFFLNTWSGWLLGAVMVETIHSKSAFYCGWIWWGAGALFAAFSIWAEWGTFYDGRMLILKFPFRILICAWPLSAFVVCEQTWASLQGIAGKLVRIFSWIGLSSYSLYLLHCPLIEIEILLFDPIKISALKVVLQTGWLFAIIGICWLTYRYIEIRFMAPSTKSALQGLKEAK